jgi:hypothetical protein
MAGREGPVRARAERYATLRAVSRAVARLASSNVAAEPDDWELGQPGLRELEGRLREAEHQGETSLGASGALLARIDGELDTLAAETLACFRGIPLSRLRAAIPALRRSDPEGAASLLELCLQSGAQESEEKAFLDAALALLRSTSSEGPRLRSGPPAPPREADATLLLDEPEPLDAIAHELLRRLAGTTPGEGGAAEIAAALDLAKLTAFEKSVLRRSDADAVAPILRSAVALRLIAQRLSKLSPRLTALGLDPTTLRRERVPELCAELGSAMSALSGRAYEDARQIAALRGSLLAAWGEEPAGGARQHSERIRHAARSPSVAPRSRRGRGVSGRRTSSRKLRIACALAIAAILAILVGAALLH